MSAKTQSELYRELPSVDEVVRSAEVQALASGLGASAVTDAARMVLERLRKDITEGRLDGPGLQMELKRLPSLVDLELRQSFSFSLRAAINATGVILHTNLGRAPLSAASLAHIQKVAGGYSNLEFDLTTGERGKRDLHVQKLLGRLLKDHAPSSYEVSTVVVNNCAAAVMLALNTLAEGGEVIVSRGELVEIGGSFRVPEIMAKSGAMLREVGTTNRTRISDYERAINDKTRLLLRVHRSNFAIVGFTEQPSVEELVALGYKHKIPVMEDLGNGAIFDLQALGIQNESGVRESLRAGVEVITYSGDKLLGGPQSGLISGRKELVGRIRSNPLFRALRVDKLTYAALEATLLAYLREDYDSVPVLGMMRLSASEIQRRAEELAGRLPPKQFDSEVIAGESVIGGGTAPAATLKTFLISLSSSRCSVAELQKRLRQHDPPIIVRIEDEKIRIDLRTVSPEHDSVIVDALLSIR